jgi:hypothetical protein
VKLLPKLPGSGSTDKQAAARQAVLRKAAQIGGELFGPIPVGHRREFFCLDAHTWVWHEEWTDARGVRQVITTHYTVRPDGIIKSQNNDGYRLVEDTELRNLKHAVALYGERVPAELARYFTAS